MISIKFFQGPAWPRPLKRAWDWVIQCINSKLPGPAILTSDAIKISKEYIDRAAEASKVAALTDVEKWFMQGCIIGMRMGDSAIEPKHIYDKGTTQRLWWTRGYSYMGRLKRALTAEADARTERMRANKAELNFKALSRQADVREDEASDQFELLANKLAWAGHKAALLIERAKQAGLGEVWDVEISELQSALGLEEKEGRHENH